MSSGCSECFSVIILIFLHRKKKGKSSGLLIRVQVPREEGPHQLLCSCLIFLLNCWKYENLPKSIESKFTLSTAAVEPSLMPQHICFVFYTQKENLCFASMPFSPEGNGGRHWQRHLCSHICSVHRLAIISPRASQQGWQSQIQSLYELASDINFICILFYLTTKKKSNLCNALAVLPSWETYFWSAIYIYIYG